MLGSGTARIRQRRHSSSRPSGPPRKVKEPSPLLATTGTPPAASPARSTPSCRHRFRCSAGREGGGAGLQLLMKPGRSRSRLFEPWFTVKISRPWLGRKLPIIIWVGSLPTGNVLGFWSLKKPSPTPGSTVTWFEPPSLTRMLGMPLTYWTTVDVGPTPAWSLSPGTNVKPPLAVGSLSRMKTSFEPWSATTRSRRPLPRSATVTLTGSVPVT